MRTNVARKNYTHEGARAYQLNPLLQLRRSVMACMLWEREFYESGETIAGRIMNLCEKVDPREIAELAIEARSNMRLRHVPLLLLVALVKHGQGKMVGETIYQVIQRADEMTEFLSLYWRDGRSPLTKQMKVGLARAFHKFDAYQLAKYDRPGMVKLRDVLFLSHAKPVGPEQEKMWRQLADGELPAADTWESNLSSGEDKRETFERLIREKKLGYMALLRNLRKMSEVGVSSGLIKSALVEGARYSKALPFRFIAAAKHAPQFERELDAAMSEAMLEMPKLSGKTVLLVDVSASMHSNLSQKSDLTREDAASALAILASGISDDLRVFTFSMRVQEVPPRQGMALAHAIQQSQPNSGTYLGEAMQAMNKLDYDRLIVFTDEQSRDSVPAPIGRGYMVNVASAQNGVGYGSWLHIDGFSESVVQYIQEHESRL